MERRQATAGFRTVDDVVVDEDEPVEQFQAAPTASRPSSTVGHSSFVRRPKTWFASRKSNGRSRLPGRQTNSVRSS